MKKKLSPKEEIKKEDFKQELRFDLLACYASNSPEDQKSIQDALEHGYEPFAVSPSVLPPKPGASLAVGAPVQPQMVTTIWFKRGILVNVKYAEENNEATK